LAKEVVREGLVDLKNGDRVGVVTNIDLVVPLVGRLWVLERVSSAVDEVESVGAGDHFWCGSQRLLFLLIKVKKL